MSAGLGDVAERCRFRGTRPHGGVIGARSAVLARIAGRDAIHGHAVRRDFGGCGFRERLERRLGRGGRGKRRIRAITMRDERTQRDHSASLRGFQRRRGRASRAPRRRRASRRMRRRAHRSRAPGASDAARGPRSRPVDRVRRSSRAFDAPHVPAARALGEIARHRCAGRAVRAAIGGNLRGDAARLALSAPRACSISAVRGAAIRRASAAPMPEPAPVISTTRSKPALGSLAAAPLRVHAATASPARSTSSVSSWNAASDSRCATLTMAAFGSRSVKEAIKTRFVLGVERARRFVEEQIVGLVQQHARGGEALLLARRENARPVRGFLQTVRVLRQVANDERLAAFLVGIVSAADGYASAAFSVPIGM